MTGSLYCQIGFTIERYLVVCHPFYTVAKQWSVKRYIIPLVTFSIFYNLPKFFELDTLECDSELFHKQHENITGSHNWTLNATLYAPTEMRRKLLPASLPYWNEYCLYVNWTISCTHCVKQFNINESGGICNYTKTRLGLFQVWC